MDYTKASQTLSYLLQNLANLEKESELHRAVLSNKNTLNLASAFHYIDYRNQGSIKPGDIRLFMEENGVNLNNDDINTIFNCIDQNRDGQITWKEFQKFFLNTEFLDLPQLHGSPTISKEVARCLIDLMNCELNGNKEIEKLKDTLNSDVNFNSDDYFKKLDTFSKGFLDVRDIYDYLAQNTDSITYKKAERVMKRIDGNSSGRITPDKWRSLFPRKSIVREVVRQPIRITDDVQTRPRSREPVIRLREVKNINLDVPVNKSIVNTPNVKSPITTVKKKVVEEVVTKKEPPVPVVVANTVVTEEPKKVVKKIVTTTTVQEAPEPVEVKKEPVVQLPFPPKSKRVKRTTVTTTTVAPKPPLVEKKKPVVKTARESLRAKQLLDRFLHSELKKTKPLRNSVYETRSKYRKPATPEKRPRKTIQIAKRSPSQPVVNVTHVVHEPVNPFPQISQETTMIENFSPTQHPFARPPPFVQKPLAVSMIQTTSPILIEKAIPRIERPTLIPFTKNVVVENSRSPPRNVEIVRHNPSPLKRIVESKLSCNNPPPVPAPMRNSRDFRVLRQSKYVENPQVAPEYRIKESLYRRDGSHQNSPNFVTLGKLRDSPLKKSLQMNQINQSPPAPIIKEEHIIHRNKVVEFNYPLAKDTLNLSPDFNINGLYNSKRFSPSKENIFGDLKQNTLKEYHNKFDSRVLPPKGKSSTKKYGYHRRRESSPKYITPDKISREPSKQSRNKMKKRNFIDLPNYDRINRTNEKFREKYGLDRGSPTYKRSPYYEKLERNLKIFENEPRPRDSLRKKSYSKFTKMRSNDNEDSIQEYSYEREDKFMIKSYAKRDIKDDTKITKISIETEDFEENSVCSVVSQEETTPNETRRVKIKTETDTSTNLQNRVIEKHTESPNKKEKTLIFDRYNPDYRSKIPDIFDKDDVEEVSVTKNVYTAQGLMKKIVTTKKAANGEIIVTERLLRPDEDKESRREKYEYSKYGREFGDSIEKRYGGMRDSNVMDRIRRRRTYTTSSPVQFKYINPKGK